MYHPSPAPTDSMVLSCLFFLDLKGKILISRDYRGDISASHAEEFIEILYDREINLEMNGNEGGIGNSNGSSTANLVSNVQPPIFHKNGISYCYIKYNNLYCKKNFILNFFYILHSACNDEKEF